MVDGRAMELESHNRFDPQKLAQLLVEIAQERSVEPIFKKVVEHAVEETAFVVF